MLYETSGGGMTVSGGEPFAQFDFTRALLAAAREADIHTAVEATATVNWHRLNEVLPLVDLFLVDWKETDPALHREYIGVDNARIRENLGQLNQAGADFIIRCPIVPGLNDRSDHFAGIAALSVELERFGLADRMEVRPPTPSDEAVAAWIRECRALGGRILNEPPDGGEAERGVAPSGAGDRRRDP